MLDIVEETKFSELRKLCSDLKVPAPPEIMIGFQVHDKNGVLIFDDKQRGHSWTRNFYNSLFGFCGNCGADGGSSFGTGYMSGKTTGGDIYSYTTAQGYFSSYNALILGNGFTENTSVGLFGIKVGTDDTAFSPEQTHLIAPISSGTSTGQLSHVPMVAGTITYTGGTTTWKATLYRIFNNNSGAIITVKEAGLYSQIGLYVPGLAYYLFERSVPSPSVSVAIGAQLTVTYEISLDFSAID